MTDAEGGWLLIAVLVGIFLTVISGVISSKDQQRAEERICQVYLRADLPLPRHCDESDVRDYIRDRVLDELKQAR